MDFHAAKNYILTLRARAKLDRAAEKYVHIDKNIHTFSSPESKEQYEQEREEIMRSTTLPTYEENLLRSFTSKALKRER